MTATAILKVFFAGLYGPRRREAVRCRLRLLSLSPNSVQIVSEKSGHWIQGDNPKLVIASVREVMDAVRAHRRLDASVLTALAHEDPPEQ
jgi:hypothetical protein